MDNCSAMCGKLLLTLMEQILPGESPDLKEVVNPVSSLSYVLSVTTACLSQQVQAVIQLLSQGSDDHCHYHYAVSTGGKYGIITFQPLLKPYLGIKYSGAVYQSLLLAVQIPGHITTGTTHIQVILTNQITTWLNDDFAVQTDLLSPADEFSLSEGPSLITRLKGSSRKREGGSGYVTTALGNTWSHSVNTRLILQYLDSGTRQLLVAKSPIAPFTSFLYVIEKSGLVLQGGSCVQELLASQFTYSRKDMHQNHSQNFPMQSAAGCEKLDKRPSLTKLHFFRADNGPAFLLCPCWSH
nr:uncharacterized protein LOC110076400 [Pogona vitticeps]